MAKKSKGNKKADKAIGKLKKKLKKLRRKLALATTPPPAAPLVSPLAPKGGFPVLPVIAGVEFAAAEAGVKYQGRLDVMLARIAPGSAIAGVFTRSSTRSAPVLDCQDKLAKLAAEGAGDKGFAILVNSGNSNAFTGAVGVEAVQTICKAAAKMLKLPESHVFTASTGVIGVPLPAERITAVLDQMKAELSDMAGDRAARAIMTTDTFAKGAVAEVKIDGKTIRIAGFAKGSGMIAPDMATMLVYIFTDAAISQPDLQKCVSSLNRTTFNAITVDSDTSTSDSLMIAATGKSGVQIGGAGSASGKAFAEALGGVMQDLAHQVVKDGEGATKFVEVAVTGATTQAAAHKVAMAIANSPLVKTAIAGEDPNWGRIVMAVGKSGARADRDKLTIRFGEVLVAENGWVSPDYREEDGAAHMQQQDLKIAVDMGLGSGQATVWTCDLTKRYIEINADYRS
ncbi:MAG: bifunctional glutamate N-acetyltransferase/amino-acid acetyltransferase ArgJ [Rhodobacteraceae bacterium]|nr:bifunctional glutamate N-acetyltransferase/amino-acid acetyltransferase ArgJ [Paracoccaceae bacterium]